MREKNRVNYISTWNVKCGIAEYSKFLINAMNQLGDVITNIFPVINETMRKLKNPFQYLKLAFSVDKSCDIVHIQYQPSFFIIYPVPLSFFPIMIAILRLRSKAKVVVTIHEFGLSNRVRFYQDLPRQELLKMYARAGVFVLLSQHEAFSIVVAEALAAKTPCIVANTSALSEWIDNKNCFGIDYPVNDDNLADLITKVIGKEIGNVKLSDWDEVAQQIDRLYKEN